jgi:hypothetical protein
MRFCSRSEVLRCSRRFLLFPVFGMSWGVGDNARPREVDFEGSHTHAALETLSKLSPPGSQSHVRGRCSKAVWVYVDMASMASRAPRAPPRARHLDQTRDKECQHPKRPPKIALRARPNTFLQVKRALTRSAVTADRCAPVRSVARDRQAQPGGPWPRCASRAPSTCAWSPRPRAAPPRAR